MLIQYGLAQDSRGGIEEVELGLITDFSVVHQSFAESVFDLNLSEIFFVKLLFSFPYHFNYFITYLFESFPMDIFFCLLKSPLTSTYVLFF